MRWRLLLLVAFTLALGALPAMADDLEQPPACTWDDGRAGRCFDRAHLGEWARRKASLDKLGADLATSQERSARRLKERDLARAGERAALAELEQRKRSRKRERVALVAVGGLVALGTGYAGLRLGLGVR